MKIIPKVKWYYPMNVERSYILLIRRSFRKLFSDAKAKLLTYMTMTLANNRYKQDNEADDIDNILEGVSIINKADLAYALLRVAQNCNEYNKGQFIKVIKNAIGVDVFQAEPQLADMLDVWVSDNIALIKKLEGDALTTVGSLSKQAVMNGWSMKQLEAELQKKIDMTDRHAKLIARDQTGKLNSSLSKYRQTSCGIKQYIWKTAHDSRVREEHAYRNDHVFSWDKPPDDGHPGFPVRCRCIALPIVDTNDFMYKGVIPQSELAGKNARRSAEVLEGEKISENALAIGGEGGIIITNGKGLLSEKMSNWTPCLKDRKTGETIKTVYEKATTSDLKGLKKVGWNFDWLKAPKYSDVYKLKLVGSEEIQGLLSISDKKEDMAMFVNIVESAPHNLGKKGRYFGVGPHLMAIAAKLSFDKGYDAYVYFISKTALIEHYKKTLNATQIGNSQRMYLDSIAAKKLVDFYLKGE